MGGGAAAASLGPACPANAVTNARRRDGVGAQYASLVSVFAWSELVGRPFCPTPWTEMGHGANATVMWSLVGGGALGPIAAKFTEGFSEKHAQMSGLQRLPQSALAAVRAAYSGAPKPALEWFAPGAAHVAVHVRRGDICGRNRNGTQFCLQGPGVGRFTSNGLTARCAVAVAQNLSRAAPIGGVGGNRPRPVHVHVFSEGRPDDFGPLQRLPFPTHWHLSAPLDATFHHLVAADALVLARSTLSDGAAMLSEGELFAPEGDQGGQIHYLHGHRTIHQC